MFVCMPGQELARSYRCTLHSTLVIGRLRLCWPCHQGSQSLLGSSARPQKLFTRELRRMCSMQVYKKLNRSRLNDISLVGSNSLEPFNPRGVFYDPMQQPCDVESYSKRLKTLVLCFGASVLSSTVTCVHLLSTVACPFRSPYLVQYADSMMILLFRVRHHVSSAFQEAPTEDLVNQEEDDPDKAL